MEQELISGVIKGLVGPVTDGINNHMDKKFEKIEAEKSREFTRELLEVELYKNGFGKEIKEVFDYWTDCMRVTHIKENENLTTQQKNKYENEYKKLVDVSKVSEMNTKTLKYAGINTVTALTTNSYILQNKADYNESIVLYSYSSIFAALKKDILNIELFPEDILMVYTNDISSSSNLKLLNTLKKEYFEAVKKVNSIRSND